MTAGATRAGRRVPGVSSAVRGRGSPTRYRCLIIDHDDTAVDSTRRVHFPAHLRSMEVLRPGVPPIDIDTWFEKNCDPGIMSFLVDELRLSPEELAVEHEIWRSFTARETPHFYPGFLEALAAYKAAGGRVAVVSHSESHVIMGHYREQSGAAAVVPDLVFGWDLEPAQRKPNPYPVHETVRRLGVAPGEVLVVDDLRPGIDMALAAGVDAAAAGWAHDVPSIREFMRRNCVACFATVGEFAEFVLR
ncbi:MAG TPA: HAD family hydrolase [Thermoanaerobaculaceae bacterium]|nr:HAD family hydrolase [Thermoanaerobaculaceae bacterium]